METPELNREVGEPRSFSIDRSPFLRLLRRLHLVRADGAARAQRLVAMAWLPLFLGSIVRAISGLYPAAILFDLSVHVRLLIVIPIVLAAERLLEERCRGAVIQLYAGHFADDAVVDPIIDRAERFRDSRLAELVIVGISVAIGQAVLWGFVGPTGLVAGVVHAGPMSFARVWYGVVALPIMHFVLYRWFWHWMIWSYVVVHLSRLPLATNATHPDHAAGLGFLAGPISAFSMFVLATAFMLASAWGTQLLAGQATVETFLPMFVAFVIVAALIACGPLLAYVGVLYRARHRETNCYNGFALEYVRAFKRKWIDHVSGETILGSSDIQAFNDLGGVYASLDRARLLVFGVRAVAGIWVAAIVPMLPIAISAIPVETLLRHVAGVMLGGLPI